MALDWGYCDSTTYTLVGGVFPRGNKAKSAEFNAAFMKFFMSSGVSPSFPNSFKITAAPSGLNVIRAAGEAIGAGVYLRDKNANTLAVTAGAVNYHYFRWDASLGEVDENIYVNPPEGSHPVRSGDIYEMLTAKITVPSGASAVTQSMIVDLRPDAAKCGWSRINVGMNINEIAVTADMIQDTPDRAIPTKTGTRAQTLRGDGAFDTDLDGMTVGAYQIVKDTANNAAAIAINQPSAESMKFNANVYQYISGSTPQNPNNMLTGLYDNLAAGTEGSQPANFYLFFDLPAGLPTPPNAATNAQIKYRVKISRQLGGYQNGGITFALYNVASGAVTTQVPNADLVFNSSNPMPTTATIYEKTVTGLTYGNKYALKVTSSALGYYNYIYGAEIEISYTMPSRKLIDLKPNNVTLFDNYIFVREDNPSAGAVNIDVVYKPTGMIVAKITPQGLTDGAGTMLAVLQASLSNNYQLMLLQGGLI